jgi:epoxyqueuosine reductase
VRTRAAGSSDPAATALTSDRIKAKARELGFDLCGVARAEAYPELAFFSQWLARGYAGEMHYLARTAHARSDLRHVLPSARTVVVLGTNYHTNRPYSTEVTEPGGALIARYAWGDDYHEVIGARLEALEAWMRELAGGSFESRRYVDTGPVQERALAQRAGLGWIGKNACLISPSLGSWLFLSEIICSVDLEPDEPGFDRCGTCTLCLEACPTGAIVEPAVVDSTRCLSYLTIELRGPVPEPLVPAVGAHVYGCDICQEVCPWNASPPVSADPAWQPRPAFDRPQAAALAALSDDELRVALRHSAMKRAKIAGLRRNLAIVTANAGRQSSPP